MQNRVCHFITSAAYISRRSFCVAYNLQSVEFQLIYSFFFANALTPLTYFLALLVFVVKFHEQIIKILLPKLKKCLHCPHISSE